jgi:hypothetical protein
MKMRSAGRVRRIGFAFALAFLACGAAMASDVERQIPVIRDETGSDVSVEIQSEGSRSTARPCLYASKETVERVTDRIGGKIDAWKASNAGAGSSAIDDGTSEPAASPCSIETLRRRAAGAKVSRTVVPDPAEITVRSVRGFLKGLRASRKEKPAPAVVVAVPELRLGMADTSPRETN